MAKKTETQAIEKKKPKPAAVLASEFLNARSDKLAKWCVEGSGLTALDLVRVGTMVVSREPKFHDPRVWPSLYLALITAGQLGLEPAGPMSEGYIIPYWDKKMGINLAQFQPGYRGLMKLITQSGEIDRIRSQVVYANDDFGVDFMDPDDKEKNFHRPAMGDRGDPIGVYSRVRYEDGTHGNELAGWDDVIKAKNSAKGKSPAWDNWEEQMARKFIIKRHANQLPLSPVARKAIDVDNIDTESSAIDTQRVIDIDEQVIKELPAPKEESKLASKLKGRKAERTKDEPTPQPSQAEKMADSLKGAAKDKGKSKGKGKGKEDPKDDPADESKGTMCNFCGQNQTDKEGEPCKECRDEIAAEEAEDSKGNQ